jgi:predicted site-specific integrase-resolvase
MNQDAPTTQADGAFLTPQQLCARWQMAERTLREWNRRRVVPFFKLGGKLLRYRRADVEAFEGKGWRAARRTK